jgi:hypothetical protein
VSPFSPCRGEPGARYGIFAKVGENVIHFDAGPAKNPISQAQGIRLARATAVSPDRLGESVGRLSASELRDLDAALALVLGL